MDRFSNILKQRLEATQSPPAVHPSSDTLVAFVERGLNGSQRESVLAHLSVCPECRDAVALATPEASAANAQATFSLSRALEFSAATRWASLAAALAVAVGVGVIAYEHEPRLQNASFSAAQEKANPPVAPGRISKANEQVTSKQLESPVANSSAQNAPTKLAAPIQDERRERILAKKKPEPSGGIAGALVATRSGPESKDRFQYRAQALPPAPEVQPTFADKRDADSMIEAEAVPAAPVARAASVPLDNKSEQAVNDHATGGYGGGKGTAVAANNRSVGTSAGTALLESETAPSAKTVNPVSISGSSAKARFAYGMRSFVHWTISAAGQLQRRAVDGTLTIVEPVKGAIIRAVAAEGIEVWAGGSQTPPGPKNIQPRSVLFHSSDAGETWKAIDGPWQGSIERVNLAGFGSLTVVTTDGTWSTGDAGKSWSKP